MSTMHACARSTTSSLPKNGIVTSPPQQVRTVLAAVNQESSMIHVGHFLTSHPLGLLAVTVLLEQAGIPIAGAPLLLLIGALTGSESVSMPLAVLVAVSASVLVDCAWFDLGRSRKSNPVGAFKHLQSVDAGSFRICHLFTHRPGMAMFVTRFIPGPNLAAALAGLSGFSRLRFMALDIIVSGLWAFLYLA